MNGFSVRTSRRIEAVDITDQVANAIRGHRGTIVHVYTPHTTCGITINENADPDVMRDLIDALDHLAPSGPGHQYRHREGNSDAHIKAMLVGSSVSVPLAGDIPALGTWQGIFLLEFDGPRERKVSVAVT